MRARTRRHVSSAILFPFPFIAALPPLFAEHQHHLLFARSIYSVNYICLCSRYTAVVLSSVNCAFTFFPPPLYFYLPFFMPASFFVCSFFPFSHIACNSVFRAVRDFVCDIASRVARAESSPADRLCQTFRTGPFEASSKFSIRTLFFGVSTDLPGRACGRKITGAPLISAPFFFHFSFISPRYFARARTLHYIVYLTRFCRTFAIP